MKVLFITNIPSPYRVDFFNELGKECELTVLFEKRASDERDDLWKDYQFNNFDGIFMKGISVGAATSVCFSVKKYLDKNKYDVIICSDFTSPTGIIAINYMKRHNIPYYLECDGGFAKSGRGLKERIKNYTISGARGYFSTGKDCDEYYLAYGAKKYKIIRFPFTSVYQKDILSEPIPSTEKKELKKQLGITDAPTVITVGQFIHRKGFDILLKAAGVLDRSIQFYFIGGEPTEEYLQIKGDLKLDNAHFIGFQSHDTVLKYFQAADIFVLPTREDIWGLVINEAVSNGLPVISTDRCSAALELVKNELNGFIVPVEDVKLLANRIKRLAEDEELRIKMTSESISVAQKYSIEKMAFTHIGAFERISNGTF